MYVNFIKQEAIFLKNVKDHVEIKTGKQGFVVARMFEADKSKTYFNKNDKMSFGHIKAGPIQMTV